MRTLRNCCERRWLSATAARPVPGRVSCPGPQTWLCGFDRRNDSVPQPASGLKSEVDRLLALAPLAVIVTAQVGQHLHGHRRVLFRVDLNVAPQVIHEYRELVTEVPVDLHYLIEHVGDKVLAAERERGGLAMNGQALDEAPGSRREFGRWLRYGSFLERGQHRLAVAQQPDEAVDGAAVGPRLSHAVEVELEVADEAAAEFVALLDEHDVVD